MSKVKFILLIPLTYNDGTEVASEVLSQIEDEVFLLAGGYTIAGEGRGAYQMESGAKQVDRSLQMWIVVDEDQEQPLKELVAKFGKTLGQESMYLERASSVVEFIAPSSQGNEP